jgi:hypothetical protein
MTDLLLSIRQGACKQNSGPIQAGSCGAFNACCSNTAPIGEGQCNKAGECSNCNGEGTSPPTQKPFVSPTASGSSQTFAPSYYPSYVPTKKISGKILPHSRCVFDTHSYLPLTFFSYFFNVGSSSSETEESTLSPSYVPT